MSSQTKHFRTYWKGEKKGMKFVAGSKPPQEPEEEQELNILDSQTEKEQDTKEDNTILDDEQKDFEEIEDKDPDTKEDKVKEEEKTEENNTLSEYDVEVEETPTGITTRIIPVKK